MILYFYTAYRAGLRLFRRDGAMPCRASCPTTTSGGASVLRALRSCRHPASIRNMSRRWLTGFGRTVHSRRWSRRPPLNALPGDRTAPSHRMSGACRLVDLVRLPAADILRFRVPQQWCSRTPRPSRTEEKFTASEVLLAPLCWLCFNAIRRSGPLRLFFKSVEFSCTHLARLGDWLRFGEVALSAPVTGLDLRHRPWRRQGRRVMNDEQGLRPLTRGLSRRFVLDAR